MRWHLAAWAANLNNTNNQDTAFVADEVLQRRNNHLIVTEPYNLIGAMAIGADQTRCRFNNVGLITYGVPHIWPVNRSATIPSRPSPTDMRGTPFKLTVNEEIIVEISQDGPAMGTSQSSLIGWIATPDWTRNVPRGLYDLVVRATANITAGAENAWTALGAITMERDLLGGSYSMIGCHAVNANALAFRWRFPRQPCIQGRQHRPGGIVQNATGDLPWPPQSSEFGEWGRFHTFELPEVQFLSDAAGGATIELRLHLVYLGADEALVAA